MKRKTDFGFQEVELEEKEPLVQGVFSSVASNYDIMNDFMSFGLHRAWKQDLIKEIGYFKDRKLLDVAGGTGDIATKFLKAGGTEATVVDLNQEMLAAGKAKRRDLPIDWVHANAEDLPFESDIFDYYTISFGIRNVSNINKALREAHRVLKSGGKFICLEFSHISQPLIEKLYNFYSMKIIPQIGQVITNDREAYEYLVQSIQRFQTAKEFERNMKSTGFEFTEYKKLTFGVVAIHTGFKV